MIYDDIIKNQMDKMLSLHVRKVDETRIMIEGDIDSLLYLSEYIKYHANRNDSCCIDVPLKVNLIEKKLDKNEYNLFIHRLPCNEDC